MPRLSLWKDGKRSDDFRFIDRACNEMFVVGGTSVLIHKYLGPDTGASILTVTAAQPAAGTDLVTSSTANVSVGQWVFGPGIAADTKIGAKTATTVKLTKSTTQALAQDSQIWISSVNDPSRPVFTQDNPLNIQDWLTLENRDRKYDPDVYDLRGVYNVQDLDFDLSQFGLFLQNDIIFITFHLNDMVQRLGRKIMAGDVLELPHLKDYYDLDETIAAALPRFYVVQDAIRSAEGYSPTWWPHLWRIKAKPMPATQEYRDILDQLADPDNAGNVTVGNLVSTVNTLLEINDAVIAAAEKQVPQSGYDTTPFWIPPQTAGDKNQPPMLPTDSPDENFGGYLVGDGIPPNGIAVTSGISFPTLPSEGDYFLRVDFKPNRLYVRKSNRWVYVERAQRTSLTPGTGSTQRDGFINNANVFVNSQGNVTLSKQTLSTLLGPESDF